MKAERQQKEATSRVMKFPKNVGKSFMNNRIDHIAQRKIVNIIGDGNVGERAVIQCSDPPQSQYIQACSQHVNFIINLDGVLHDMLSDQDPIVQNTGNWLTTKSKPILCVVTPTGDSDSRVKEAKRDCKTDMAYFPKPVKYTEGIEKKYNDGDFSDPDVFIGKKAKGWLSGDRLVLVSTKSWGNRGSIIDTLVHELQHYADKSEGREFQSRLVRNVSDQEALKAFRCFATEFRAHYLMQEHKSLDRKGIMEHIRSNYPIVRDAHKNPKLTIDGYRLGEHMVKFVRDLKERRYGILKYFVSGFNGLNSARINDLYDTLDKIEDDKIVDKEILIDKIRALDSYDKLFIHESANWKEKFKQVDISLYPRYLLEAPLPEDILIDLVFISDQ